jgi:heme exporter protein CcmD
MIASQWPYIVSAWAVTIVALAGYIGFVLRRGRDLSRRVPPEQRRWM